MQEELLREILSNHKYPEVAKSGGVVPEEAHFNLKEVELLNSLQGKEVRLPDHGNIRSFMPLAELFSDPTYLRLVKQIIDNLGEHQVDDGEIEYALDEFTEENKDKTTEQPESPLATLEASEGIGGDTEICLCPSNMLDFFDEMRGFTSVNPNDGKRQYFLPLLLPLAGAILGGLAGPSIAGGLMGIALGTIGTGLATAGGAALGSKLMGAKWKDAAKYGVLGGLGSMAAPAIGGMFGAGTAAGANAVGSVATNATAQATNAAVAAAPAVASGATSAASSIGSTLMSPGVMIPTALMGGMLYKANQDQQKLQQKYENEMSTYNQRHDKNVGAVKDYFSKTDVSLHKEPQRDYLNSHQTETGSSHGISPMYGFPTGQYYAQGGRIEDKSGGIIGDGKGQQDNIHDDYDVGDYIMPADVTSGLGDGHTDAGYQELDSLKNYIYKNKDVHEAYEKVPVHIKAELTKKQPVAVSPGEYRFGKNITVAVGDGDLKKADSIFQEFYKLVRNDKRTSGNTIPKQAKSAIEYFKTAQNKVDKRGR